MHVAPPFILTLTLLTSACLSVSEPPAPVSPQAANPTQTQAPRPPSGTPGTTQPTVTAAPGTPTSGTPAAGGTAVTTTGTPAAATTPMTGALAPNDLQSAWTARGLAVGSGASPTATGFSVTPTAVKVTKGSDDTDLIVFTYPNQAALEQDWVVGAAVPTPRAGKSAGDFTGAWWNQNVVVVVRTRSAATDDAREAFLGLGNVAPIVPATPSTPAASGTAPSQSPVAGTPGTIAPIASPVAPTPTPARTAAPVVPTTSAPR